MEEANIRASFYKAIVEVPDRKIIEGKICHDEQIGKTSPDVTQEGATSYYFRSVKTVSRGHDGANTGRKHIRSHQ